MDDLSFDKSSFFYLMKYISLNNTFILIILIYVGMIRKNKGSEMMEIKNIKLTNTDRIILNSYRSMLDGLADYLGSGFEFVLHSLEDFDQSVIKIINGQHTGRKLGAPITDLALNMLSKIQNENLDGHVAYESKNKKGSPLRSTTIVIYGEKHRIIGLICINFYIDTPLSQCFPFFETANKLTNSLVSENFADDVDTLVKSALDEAKALVEADQSIPSSLRNKEIVSILHQQGLFKIKDAVIKVASLLQISKNTIYMHLRSIKENEG